MSKTVSKFSLAVGVVLAMGFMVSCTSDDSSAFVGKWVLENSSRSLELFKDGTGVSSKKGNGVAISWKVVENKRFVMTAPDFSQAYNYEISERILILTDDDGESKTYLKYQEGKMEGTALIDKRDGKKYKTVIIGTQTWMAENLNYEAKSSKCYDNKPANCKKYGRLYNWNAAMKSCPSGWHLPSHDEYEALDRAVGGEKIAGKKLKAKNGWNEGGNGTDEFSFSALPGGGSADGNFNDVGGLGFWWSASDYDSGYRGGMWFDGQEHNVACFHSMGYNEQTTFSGNSLKPNLFSVRCLQDNGKLSELDKTVDSKYSGFNDSHAESHSEDIMFEDLMDDKPNGRGQPKKSKGQPNPPKNREVLKMLTAKDSNSNFSTYNLINDKNLAKDMDKVLKNVAGLQTSDKTELGGRRGAATGDFNDDYAEENSGSPRRSATGGFYAEGGSGGIGDMMGGSTGGIGGTKAKGSLKAPSARDIDMGSGDGARSKAEVIAVVNARMPGLRNIYNKYLKLKSGFSGKVTLKFTIAPGGDIISIAIVSSTTDYPEFDNAVKNMVGTWKWKAIKSGNTTPTIPFNFTE
jgi:TonB family protein